ncbi:hypothetical protein Tsubulata_044758 [Turnera subulata]|uniref:Leucine-rich repeat-containing N-terminal plant-type domain-containing protein n=1 Tax=Turnera subulata TaxID=218843 RepID=A0A9Q0F4L9_9ROSI|nr:hypothetical protein Tsubulata_044758 [Turnera subulata]
MHVRKEANGEEREGVVWAENGGCERRPGGNEWDLGRLRSENSNAKLKSAAALPVSVPCPVFGFPWLMGATPLKYVGQLSSLEMLNISSNYFSGAIPAQLSYLKNLQTLILDHNNFTGEVRGWLSSLHVLAVLLW